MFEEIKVPFSVAIANPKGNEFTSEVFNKDRNGPQRRIV